jgi:hypothetical protein
LPALVRGIVDRVTHVAIAVGTGWKRERGDRRSRWGDADTFWRWRSPGEPGVGS